MLNEIIYFNDFLGFLDKNSLIKLTKISVRLRTFVINETLRKYSCDLIHQRKTWSKLFKWLQKHKPLIPNFYGFVICLDLFDFKGTYHDFWKPTLNFLLKLVIDFLNEPTHLFLRRLLNLINNDQFILDSIPNIFHMMHGAENLARFLFPIQFNSRTKENFLAIYSPNLSFNIFYNKSRIMKLITIEKTITSWFTYHRRTPANAHLFDSGVTTEFNLTDPLTRWLWVIGDYEKLMKKYNRVCGSLAIQKYLKTITDPSDRFLQFLFNFYMIQKNFAQKDHSNQFTQLFPDINNITIAYAHGFSDFFLDQLFIIYNKGYVSEVDFFLHNCLHLKDDDIVDHDYFIALISFIIQTDLLSIVRFPKFIRTKEILTNNRKYLINLCRKLNLEQHFTVWFQYLRLCLY